MWLIIISILGVMLGFKILDGDFLGAAFIAALILLTTVIKLFSTNKALELKYLILEKKLGKLEEKIAQSLMQPLPTESVAPITSTATIAEVKQTTAVEAEYIISQESNDFESYSHVKDSSSFIDEMVNTQQQYNHESHVYTKNTPNFIDEMVNKIKVYFTTGNPLVKVGGIILFFGLSFLIKFALTNDMISVEFGLLSVIIFAIALIGIGFKYRNRQGAFGLILQGIGIAVFYLAIFSAAKFFTLFPFSIALGIMILTVVFATFLAIIQDAFYLAIFATVGGFLAPILTSTGQGSHIVLFGYYAFLNLSIVTIAWYKSWRLLNLIGFVFTFVISTAWGIISYRPEDFATTEPFLILFFLLYVAVAVLFAYRTSFQLKAYVDSALVFGVPTVAFGLQASLSGNIEYLLSYSALGVGALYISLAWWLRDKPKFSLLAESFLALGVLFLSLVIAFAFAPEISAVIYALESGAIIWISLRQNRVYARLFALLLEIYAVGTFLNQIQYIHESMLFLNKVYLGLFILSVATLISAYVYEVYKEKIKSYEQYFHIILLTLGLVLWIGSGFYELRFSFYAYSSIYFSLSALLFMFIALRYQWKTMLLALEFFFPLSILSMFGVFYNISHPFVEFNYIALPLFMFTYYFLLAKIDFKFSQFWHPIGLWIVTILLSWEMFYYIHKLSFTIALSALPLLFIGAIYVILKHPRFWPLSDKNDLYRNLGIQGLAVMLMIWELFTLYSSGELSNFPYIPLLNPLDMMQISVVATLALWLKNINIQRELLLKLIAGAGMVFIGLFWARFVHYYGDVSYNFNSLQANGLFQTGISILYTLVALAVIIYSKHKQTRSLWIAGATLLGLVIFKLLVTDMAQTGSLERIISFLVVGILILVIGFIAPLPPKKELNL
ncbi:DUF2339 domain-containing protein [bacterium]|nr:DUF2339 domain-containing protein [bacterium]MBU1883463.1 DUF2339 domain-containing protein [bacterium]